MKREPHVRFSEGGGAQFPSATRLIITGHSKELLENEVKLLVERFLLERGLQLSPEKTCITHIEQGFDFLGQNTRRYGNRLLTTPSKKNMHAFMEKVRGVIHSNRAAKQENLIRLLNPVIRGWANYHCHIVGSVGTRKSRLSGSQSDTGIGSEDAGARLLYSLALTRNVRVRWWLGWLIRPKLLSGGTSR